MFYITQIDGESVPYDSATFRAWRAQLAEASSDEVGRTNRAEQSAASSYDSSAQVNTPSGRELSSQAVGLAGASVLQRESSAEEGAKGDLAEIPARSDVAAIVELAEVAAKGSDEKDPSEHKAPTARDPKLHNASLITAEQIMNTAPMSVEASALVTELSALFEDRNTRHIPVVTSTGLLTGLVSVRDFYRVLLDKQEDQASASPPPTYVSEVMRRNVLSARPEASLRDIARVLFKERIGALPVVTPEQSLLGLITRKEILRTVVKYWPLDLWQDH